MDETSLTHPFRANLGDTRRLVVKFGSGMLVDNHYAIDKGRVGNLVDSLSVLLERKVQVVVVSSGAVATGAPFLGFANRPRTIPQKQACAAVGQSLLMALYEHSFSQRGHHTGQVLLTQDDFRSRERYLNTRNTFETLLGEGIIPIVNENDTVAVDEIKFGDNDNLSAQVAALVGADLLLILSTVSGLFQRNPAQLGADVRPIPVVEEIRRSHFSYAQDAQSSSGISSGGMKSKLLAIQKAVQYGIPAVLASGLIDRVIERVLAGEDLGTLFLPAKDKLPLRKHWILHTLAPRGTLVVDAGAVKAIQEQGKSLLPIGISGVKGTFRPGDAVRIVDSAGNEVARGLSHYSSQDTAAISGCRSEEIESRLGHRYYDEVVHRDNLVLIR